MDSAAVLQQLQGFRAMAAELRLDVSEFCTDNFVGDARTEDDAIVHAISAVASDDRDGVTTCWRWLVGVLRSTKNRLATPTDFFYLGLCQMCLYKSLLKRPPPALEKLGVPSPGIKNSSMGPPPLSSMEGLSNQDTVHTRDHHRPRNTGDAERRPTGTVQPAVQADSNQAEQRAPAVASAQLQPAGDVNASSQPEATPAADAGVDVQARAAVREVGPAVHDKYLEEIQEALHDQPMGLPKAAHVSPEHSTSAPDATPAPAPAPETQYAAPHGGLPAPRAARDGGPPARAPADSPQSATTERQAASAANEASLPSSGRPAAEETPERPAHTSSPHLSANQTPHASRGPAVPHGARRSSPTPAAAAGPGGGRAGQSTAARPAGQAHPAPIQFNEPPSTGRSATLEDLQRQPELMRRMRPKEPVKTSTLKPPLSQKPPRPNTNTTPATPAPVRTGGQPAPNTARTDGGDRISSAHDALASGARTGGARPEPPHGARNGSTWPELPAGGRVDRPAHTRPAPPNSDRTSHARPAADSPARGTVVNPPRARLAPSQALPANVELMGPEKVPRAPAGAARPNDRAHAKRRPDDRRKSSEDDLSHRIMRHRGAETVSAVRSAGRAHQPDLRLPPAARDRSRSKTPVAIKKARVSGAHDADAQRRWPPRASRCADMPVAVLSPEPSEPPFLLEDDDSDDDGLLPPPSTQHRSSRGGSARTPAAVRGAPPEAAAAAPVALHVVEESDEAMADAEEGEVRSVQSGAAGERHGRGGAALPPPPAHDGLSERPAECLQGGLTTSEMAEAEELCREERLLYPRRLQLDLLAATLGSTYESLQDACMVYVRGCVYCTLPHPKANGMCERINELRRTNHTEVNAWRKMCKDRMEFRDAARKPYA
eukprot:jgi/Ulvmu1/12333/UM089_0017.1